MPHHPFRTERRRRGGFGAVSGLEPTQASAFSLRGAASPRPRNRLRPYSATAGDTLRRDAPVTLAYQREFIPNDPLEQIQGSGGGGGAPGFWNPFSWIFGGGGDSHDDPNEDDDPLRAPRDSPRVGPDREPEEENRRRCEAQFERDDNICRRLPAGWSRSRCFRSSLQRYAACRAGHPIPEMDY